MPPLQAVRHATRPSQLQHRSHSLRLGEKYEVRVAECGCGPFKITVRCNNTECMEFGVCQCHSLMVFSRPSCCTHVVDAPAPLQQPPAPDDEAPPPWWGVDFDEKFAEVLRVTKTSPAYIDDRLLEQFVVKVCCGPPRLTRGVSRPGQLLPLTLCAGDVS